MFVAWKDLRFAKGRFALMGVVVVLITVLVGLVSGLTAGLAHQNVSAIADLPADHLAFAAPADGAKVSFTDSQVGATTWEQWADVPGVTSAKPLAVTMTRAAVDGGRAASVATFGVEPGSSLAPDAGVADGSVVLSIPAAEALGLAAGDLLTLAGHQVRVAAVAGDTWYSHTPVVWASLTDAQPAGTTAAPTATVVALTTAPGADLVAADTRIGTSTVSTNDALVAIGSFRSENGSLQLMRGFLFAISALVIGAFFTVWTIQRSGDIAVLKALGASTRYLLRDALGQAVVLLVLGTATGSALAAGAGIAIGGAAPFVLDLSTVVVPALVMIALGTAGAGLSIRRITSVDPLTALGSAR
ncbi:MAG: ABC transporter permease [Cellulomonas sp.]